jgi:hypothetical protein
LRVAEAKKSDHRVPTPPPPPLCIATAGKII